MLGIVSLEVARIDDHAVHDRRNAEPNETPVVSGDASPARLPSVHPLASVGVFPLAPDRLLRPEKVLLRGKELIVRQQDGPTETGRGDIHQIRE